ncbi:MAG: hypothetical protein LBB04_02870 [Oscillospiraceae bacterium]|nr:hypothetical protein [Oscillospiraceae bacterium]
MDVGIRPGLPPIPVGVSGKNKGNGDPRKVDLKVRDDGGAVIIEYSAEYQEHFETIKRVKGKIKKDVDQPADKGKLKSIKAAIEAGKYLVDCGELAVDMVNLA